MGATSKAARPYRFSAAAHVCSRLPPLRPGGADCVLGSTPPPSPRLRGPISGSRSRRGRGGGRRAEKAEYSGRRPATVPERRDELIDFFGIARGPLRSSIHRTAASVLFKSTPELLRSAVAASPSASYTTGTSRQQGTAERTFCGRTNARGDARRSRTHRDQQAVATFQPSRESLWPDEDVEIRLEAGIAAGVTTDADDRQHATL
jgi:hypothetical protein